jgi:hypothetical protein
MEDNMRKSQFSRPLTIALPPDHFDQVKRITDDQQISMAQWVREAVAAALAKNQPKEDTM